MFAESIHSVADTINQIILAFGLHKSAKVSTFIIHKKQKTKPLMQIDLSYTYTLSSSVQPYHVQDK